MPTLYLIEGPVGAGKSTFASSRATQTASIHIALDEWFVRLFSQDRPATGVVDWYVQRKERLQVLIWAHSRNLLQAGKDVYLELGLIQRQNRETFCQQVQQEGFGLVLYILDAPRDIRRDRVRKRNVEKGLTFSMVVPDQIFEVASDFWESPDELELAEWDAVVIQT